MSTRNVLEELVALEHRNGIVGNCTGGLKFRGFRDNFYRVRLWLARISFLHDSYQHTRLVLLEYKGRPCLGRRFFFA